MMFLADSYALIPCIVKLRIKELKISPVDVFVSFWQIPLGVWYVETDMVRHTGTGTQ
jgi:hypothetical protein